MNNSNNSSSGIGLFTVLFLIFLVLKLTSVIAWSWWWVTVPLWGPFVAVLLIAWPIYKLYTWLMRGL